MGLSDYEKQYMKSLSDIFLNGFVDGMNERTGKATKRLPGIVIRVDVEKEFPILKSKFVAGKTALREILWIWQQQSNNIHDLKAHIWDSWADSNGTIGKAYGYQMNRPISIYTDSVHKTPESFRSYRNQAEYILEYLREFPNGRWGVATLWNSEELSGMNLVPCCHTSTWNLDGGRLNCVLDQRSGDMPYGVPFNTTQYAELMILLARDLGVKPGILTHVIADAHIYDNQMDGVDLQLKYYDVLTALDDNREGDTYRAAQIARDAYTIYMTELSAKAAAESKVFTGIRDITGVAIFDMAKIAIESKPKFRVRGGELDFFKITIDDCCIEDYSNMGKIDFGEVAV